MSSFVAQLRPEYAKRHHTNWLKKTVCSSLCLLKLQKRKRYMGKERRWETESSSDQVKKDNEEKRRQWMFLVCKRQGRDKCKIYDMTTEPGMLKPCHQVSATRKEFHAAYSEHSHLRYQNTWKRTFIQWQWATPSCQCLL